MATARLPILFLAGTLAAPLAAQQSWVDTHSRAHVVVPQSRSFRIHRDHHQPIAITGVLAEVKIVEQTATTTLDVSLANPNGRIEEAVLLLPVPDGAVVSSFLFDGTASEPTAELLPADEARRTYDDIVRRVRDPALLEFAGYNLVRSSVFPVPANGTQRVRLTYEHLLERDGERVDYLLPRSESLEAAVDWRIRVNVHSSAPISTAYSPSHELETKRVGARHLRIKISEEARTQPGHFRLSYLAGGTDVSASLLAYPDPTVGGGYFLLMAGLPGSLVEERPRIQREVTLVLDRSGSMAGEKMDQVRAAALQIIEGLEDGEAFNIIDYSTTVASFSPKPVRKSREMVLKARQYLASLRPNGGTNIHDALLEALRQDTLSRPEVAPMLPLVLFLTDGLPTVGRTNEVDIREMVEKGNVHGRRVFAFGVGADVNVPLLDRLAESTRATSAYVLPGEDVELTVAKVFRRLYGPVLSDLELRTLDDQGAVSTVRVREPIPEKLPDLFEGDQLILLGQYRGEDPLEFELEGNFYGKARRFGFSFSLAKATTRNSFVPRLWASRRIGFLVDQIRQAGAAPNGTLLASNGSVFEDPRIRELSEEILRLSTEFGVLTEYTSFLATEGTDLSDWGNLVMSCNNWLEDKAVRRRSGLSALNQGLNVNRQKGQQTLDFKNSYVDEKLERVEFTAVQQVHDRAFFRNGAQWVDGRLIQSFDDLEIHERVDWGTEEHRALLAELMEQGRQGVIALRGEILIQIGDRNVLVNNDVSEESTQR